MSVADAVRGALQSAARDPRVLQKLLDGLAEILRNPTRDGEAATRR